MKYKVIAMIWGNGNLIHKCGDVLQEHEIVGGKPMADKAIRDKFIVIEKDKK